ncbi:MAG: hypothetical protein L6305_08530 [Actinomycetia bacterium]|nr:hypothetical protein [bacterium]MCG2791774.1 hypothetical protein [Actinomycetes bacterium]
MYTPHTKLEINNSDSSKIWRYMDFEKFKNMIEDASLYFCRADKLGEKWEAILPLETIKKFSLEEKKITSSNGNIYSPIEWHKSRELRSHLINCWHVNNDESYEMWKTYTSKNNIISTKSIAIQSTIGRLKNSFHKTKERIWIGEVKYVDHNILEPKNRVFNINSPNTLEVFFLKRKEFKQEQELRAVINQAFSEHKSEIGINVKCNLNELIVKIILSPTSNEVLLSNVNKIINRYGFKLKVTKSELSKNPYM